jgi:Uma2 family endonuclease
VALRQFVREHELGVVTLPDTGFILSDPSQRDTVLAPDVAYVKSNRVPPMGSAERERFPRLCPDLVVEIASPSKSKPELTAKARLWLASGAGTVWVIWPRDHQVAVWLPGAEKPQRMLGDGDTLRGEPVLPGFAFPVPRLWE